MAIGTGLTEYLESWAGGDAVRKAVAEAVFALAEAGIELAGVCGQGAINPDQGAIVGNNSGGDAQKALDVRSHEIVVAALRRRGVGMVASEEADEAEVLTPGGLVAVATDPLDGSSNIDTNVSVGTIFSILPVEGEASPFLVPGSRQLAAGFVVYGPHTDIVLTLGEGTDIFTLDRSNGAFVLVAEKVSIAPETAEYAVNASNYRHWAAGLRNYVDDCLAGKDGPLEKNYNMRWVGSLVADASRILSRGGVFLYPGDARKGYTHGRLRILYEANPVAMVIEQCGGKATDGTQRILDIDVTELHQRTGLVFGAASEVERIGLYIANPERRGEDSPLFGSRGLFMS
ncbi:Fructose-1,6-bisphosphatase class 1 [Hartmannibacter diazotrophicus]|uniref:Fructose-1,6-bisphosphatase class 1 n=1 Tax=Hartmannibacter diazotrophicus TaxID=1482074 RepID=A0A2C9D6F3_9HYPH|nr:class 1 fructose-bisphosphatase [Hartmannibacter diazotrophicus]SON55749.1 Fructose-1,6-bisphosphatase class 1 [Hartmannibacter diazotrophicus]